ncbi:MAG: hypothetical protein L0Z68_06580 [Gammaproteobacteria bacterium]|nr:hypothetical protein [Gammaproteobacteria bacterium]
MMTCIRRSIGRGNQLDVVIIKRIDPIDESPDLGVIGLIHGWAIGEDDRMTTKCNFDVLRYTAWATTEFIKRKPDHAIATAHGTSSS